MALQDILEKIKKEADSGIEKVNAEHKSRIKELEAEYKSLKDNSAKEAEATAKIEVEKIKEKATMEAEIEAKNALLSAKREVLNQVLEQAVESLSKAENYSEIIADMLKKVELEEAEIVPAKNREDETRKAISASGKHFRLADHATNIPGGIIIKSGKIEIDNSFDTIVKQELRHVLEIELNKLLFA